MSRVWGTEDFDDNNLDDIYDLYLYFYLIFMICDIIHFQGFQNKKFSGPACFETKFEGMCRVWGTEAHQRIGWTTGVKEEPPLLMILMITINDNNFEDIL